EMMATAKGKRLCLICGSPTNYAHYGIDSCKACAEFFKRTRTTNKNYACRQGTRKCTISKSERFICRRCRFEKCKALGMSLDDPRKKKDLEKTTSSPQEEPAPSTSADPPSPPLNESILSRITREHTKSLERRRFVEMSIRATSLQEHVRVDHEGEDLLLCTWSFLMDCVKMYAGDYFTIAGACFPEFNALTLHEKRLLLQSCATRIYILETHALTAKIFRSGEGPLYMLTLTTCFDRDNVKFFIQDSNASERHNDIVRSVTYYVEQLMKIVWPMLRQIDLTDTEFHALFGLVVWQIGTVKIIAFFICVERREIRNEIFADLRRYYRDELKLEDFSVRMGNLMSLEHAIQEATSLMGEEMQTFNLLDMLHADASFLNVILQVKI
ncbi:hypothetical protein PMAYCL1PPCAC_16081, partial [Pristionchus mayeri]